ncbi:MAG: hypothetical protein M1836_004579 [Candelina mexicana]|nr:MAG: hypothetical protein M1836_004579 [Candelina mexicana]
MEKLYGRRNCGNVRQELIDTIVKRSSSIIFLPPWRGSATKIIRDNNKQTLAVFSTYIQTFAAQHLHEDERYLSLSQTKAGDEGNKDAAKALGVAPSPKSCSAFVALSGYGDSPPQSQLSAPQSVTAVFSKKQSMVSAYDFSLALATIVTNLANFLHLKTEQDADLTDSPNQDESSSCFKTQSEGCGQLDDDDANADNESSDGEETGDRQAQSSEEFRLYKVYAMFCKLSAQFDEKFMAIGAWEWGELRILAG